MSNRVKLWWRAAGVRAAKTVAQTAVATIGAAAVMDEFMREEQFHFAVAERVYFFHWQDDFLLKKSEQYRRMIVCSGIQQQRSMSVSAAYPAPDTIDSFIGNIFISRSTFPVAEV